MRSANIKSTKGDLRIELGSDVSIIAEVIEIGRCIDYLIYEAELNGAELIAFLKKFHLEQQYESMIDLDDLYIITAYDW